MTRALTSAQEIIRTNESDTQWQGTLRGFAQSALAAHQGLLIDYAYEPPSQIVPQRLYRYDVYDDYLSRHRDDFEFGFDLITAARLITGPRTFGVYIIEINGHSNHIYVGQTWYHPEERLAQHLSGLAVFHAAKPFKKGATGRLRPDLYGHLPRFRSQAKAEAMETLCARELRRAGFRVEGGH